MQGSGLVRPGGNQRRRTSSRRKGKNWKRGRGSLKGSTTKSAPGGSQEVGGEGGGCLTSEGELQAKGGKEKGEEKRKLVFRGVIREKDTHMIG